MNTMPARARFTIRALACALALLAVSEAAVAGALTVPLGDTAAVHAALDASQLARPNALPVAPHAALRIHDRQRMASALAQLYRQRDYRPLWTNAGLPTRQAQELTALLANAGDFGLQPQDYEASTLVGRLSRLQPDALGSGRPATPAGSESAALPASSVATLSQVPEWAAFDVALSDSLLRFVADVHAGRIDPRNVGFDLQPPRDRFQPADFVATLATSARAAPLMAQAEPQFIHYRLLKQALQQYRALATHPELTELPHLPRSVLRLGDTYDGAPALRRLLGALGCLPATAPSTQTQLDPALVGALRQFQWLHGLAVDGQLGPRTYAELTIPLAWRVRQIELTLERWRWLPAMTGPTLIVNIPQFRLFAFDDAQDSELGMLRMDVIVGAEYPRKQTPVFAGDMRTVIFRPYWDIPRSILTHEILPRLSHDPHYLDREHMELVRGPSDSSPVQPATSGNLKLLALGQLRLRQRPGGDNALGLVKFLFPNTHDVYLHDTPEGRLFTQAQRTFSHGCIRVSDPVALAVYALRGTAGGWDAARVSAAMHATVTQRVTLARPVHVLIVYGTAVASEDGTVHFFDDIYGHDRTLNALLDLPAPAT